MKPELKQLYAFILLCVYVLAVIGGTGYLMYDHHILFGVTNLGLAAMAWPFFFKTMKDAWFGDENSD